MEIMLLFVFIMVILLITYYNQRQTNKEIQRKREHYLNLKNDIDIAIAQFKHFIEYHSYFNEKKCVIWKAKYEAIHEKIKLHSFETLNLDKDILDILVKFEDFYLNGEKIRKNYNDHFVNFELKKYKAFFSSIEKHGLDEQQRRAVVTDEDNNLVIAGAGSGKTTTIVGKVLYLIEKYNINPEQILLIAFTNDAVQNMRQRVDVKDCEIKTFNKFGKDVIHFVEQQNPSVYSDTDEKIKHIFFDKIKTNSLFLALVNRFFSDYLFPVKWLFEFNSQKEYYEYLKNNRLITLKGEKVKSCEEAKIANFLFKNGINYRYEKPYAANSALKDWDYVAYHPDFYLTDYDIYIEHFGVTNTNYDVPLFFIRNEKNETYDDAQKRYKKGIDWKREVHNKYKTTLVETYSYEMPNILYKNLEIKLQKLGVVFKPLSDVEIWQKMSIIEDNRIEINNFNKLIVTVLNLLKSNRLSLNEIKERNDALAVSNQREKERNALFLDIFEIIFSEYENYLNEFQYIDFGDMITKATNYISQGLFHKKYKYILVDEFQDSSFGRYHLLKALLDKNPDCKLFCVGDDWQSIYRFSGSDISVFTDFTKHFGTTAESKIETTFRFGSELIRITGDFIQKNPSQKRKQLLAYKELEGKTIELYEQNVDAEGKDKTEALRFILDKLAENDLEIAEKEIFILARYNFNIKPLKEDLQYFNIVRENQSSKDSLVNIEYERIIYKQNRNLNIRFLTVHKSKGLQADYVIILNCNSGKYGFPTELSDDSVLNLLLSNADRFENGEERRLFYVALTRTKNSVFIIADKRFKSKFISELFIEKENDLCQRCKSGFLRQVNSGINSTGRKWIQIGCSNYYYGCSFTEFR